MVIEIKIKADPGIEIEIGGVGVALEKAPNPGVVLEIGMTIEGRVEMMPEIETDLNQGLDPFSHVSTNRDRSRCYRCNEYDHFARECPNKTAGRNSSNAEDSLLRMSDTEQRYALDYAKGEDF